MRPHEAETGPSATAWDVEALLNLVTSSLSDLKAQDLITIPLAEKSSIADFMVIVSGTSSRQVAAMAENLVTRLKQAAGVQARVEGLAHADWVLVDAGDIIVHLFRPEVRDFYSLEKMWAPELTRTRAEH